MAPIYPIGNQSFAKIRKEGSLYIDKTQYIRPLLQTSDYIFLGRPRRFGKSLMLSMFEAYFRGQRELFEGLAISKIESEWTQYPVIHLDFSRMDGSNEGSLKTDLELRLNEIASSYSLDAMKEGSVPYRLGLLIQRLSQKYGRNTVVLVDEYDVPVHGLESNSKLYAENQTLLRSLFQQCKASDAYIKFCFVTGVARFNQISLFSGPNNFTDVSLSSDFACICGFTREEVALNLKQGIKIFAEEANISPDKLIDMLIQHYDGYRFTRKPLSVFNPLSVLRSVQAREFGNYWVSTGISSLFVKQLSNPDFELPKLTSEWIDEENLGKIYDVNDPLSLMFQTGYMTIKEWCRNRVQLKVPNQEVMNALTKDLIPAYIGSNKVNGASVDKKLWELENALLDGDVNCIISIIDSILSAIAYNLFPKRNESVLQKENYYHTMVYLVFMMVKSNVVCEMSTSNGRSDIVAETDRFVYVFEFKMDTASDGTVADALRQIEEKGYALRFRHTGKRIFNIAVVFSEKNRNIAESGFSTESPD